MVTDGGVAPPEAAAGDDKTLAKRLLIAAGLAILATALCYVFFIRTSLGQRFDHAAALGAQQQDPKAAKADSSQLSRITSDSFAAVLLVIVAIAAARPAAPARCHRRRRRRPGRDPHGRPEGRHPDPALPGDPGAESSEHLSERAYRHRGGMCDGPGAGRPVTMEGRDRRLRRRLWLAHGRSGPDRRAGTGPATPSVGP